MERLSAILSQLSLTEAAAIVVVSAVTVHGFFKRYESTNISVHVMLLVVFPDILSVFFLPHLGYLLAIVVCHVIYYSTLIGSITVHRLSPFHPLARYPGPLLWRTSKLWGAISQFKGYQRLTIQQLHARYGDVVRIGPNELSIIDPSAIEPLLGVDGLPKGPVWQGRSLGSRSYTLISERDLDAHARRRKPWARGLSMTAIKDYEEIIAKRTTQLVEHLNGLASSEVMLSQWIGSYSFDIMGDMAFGGGSEMMRDGDTSGLKHILDGGIVAGAVFQHVPWLSIYAAKVFRDGASRLRDLGRGWATTRMKRGSLSRDMFYYLSNEDGVDATALPMTQIIPDGTLVLVAGSDTTSNTLTCLFSSLLRHPDTYRRLQAEVDKYYPAGENTFDTTHYLDMSYLNAVINETMRLYPASPCGPQRSTAVIPGGKLVGPAFLPEGTHASVHTFTMQRDPRNFSPYPEDFWPERWLAAADDATVLLPPGAAFVHNAAAFIPFSHGPMNCVGKPMALLEMRMAVCTLMQRFAMRFPAGYDPDTFDRDLKDMFLWQVPKLPVIVERRL